MPEFETFFNRLLKAVEKELADEFDKNFQRKAFFDQPWPAAKHPNPKGSLMMRSGDLRNSIQSSVQGDSIRFTSSEPYAEIMNEGGVITVTAQMKRYFWAMYYKATGGMTKTKSGKTSNNKRNRNLNAQALFWRNMALMKPGSKIKIPARRFIGRHPQVDHVIKTVVDDNTKTLNDLITDILKPKK